MVYRLVFLLQSWPIRWKRLFFHFKHILSPVKNAEYHAPASGMEWISDLLCYVADVVALPEIYESLMGIFKWNTRPLTPEEIKFGQHIFGSAILWQLVRIDHKARVGMKKNIIAYVSFNTINCRKKLGKAIMVHELVHVWQYQRYGSVYISKALHAQRRPDVYDYGGSEHLFKMMLEGKQLRDFNFEQQAEIIEDYYKLKSKGLGDAMHLQAYQYFVNQLE